MKQIPDMEQKVESTLNSLDGIQRASPQPYFFARLKARISRQDKEWGGIIGLITRPAYALTIVCLVLFVNTWIVFKSDDTTAVTTSNSQAINTSNLPEEYNLAVTTIYNYDTP
jgi:hypothetical protein